MASIPTKVAIITINWNGYDDTRACVDSLLLQSYQQLRVYIVDNGSANDEGERLTSEYANEGRVVVVRNGRNDGYAGGNNVGWRRAEADGWCDALWFVNNDATVAPDALQRIVEKSASDRRLGAIGCTILYPDRTTLYAFGGGSYSQWTGIDRLFGARQPRTEVKDLPDDLVYISGAALYLTSAGLAEAKAFDEDYFLYGEELDLCLRLRRAGLTLAIEPTAVVYHQSAASSRHLSPTYVYYFLRNRLLLMRKRSPWYTWPIVAFFFLTYYVFGLTFLLLTHGKTTQLPTLFKAIVDGMSHRWGRRDLR